MMTEFPIHICISKTHFYLCTVFPNSAPSRQYKWQHIAQSTHRDHPSQAKSENNLTRNQDKNFSQLFGEARAPYKASRNLGSIMKPGHSFPGVEILIP